MSNHDKAVSKRGVPLHGNAATLYLASQQGGMDQYIRNRANAEIDKVTDTLALEVARAVREEMRQAAAKPALRIVQGGK